MLKPTVYITGNSNSLKARKELIQVLEKHYYEVKDYHPTGDYVIDSINLAKEVKSDKKGKVGILICNSGNSMINATKFVDGIKNLLINKQTELSVAGLESANIISLGVQEFNNDEIIDISLTFLKEFMKQREEDELKRLQ